MVSVGWPFCRDKEQKRARGRGDDVEETKRVVERYDVMEKGTRKSAIKKEQYRMDAEK